MCRRLRDFLFVLVLCFHIHSGFVLRKRRGAVCRFQGCLISNNCFKHLFEFRRCTDGCETSLAGPRGIGSLWASICPIWCATSVRFRFVSELLKMRGPFFQCDGGCVQIVFYGPSFFPSGRMLPAKRCAGAPAGPRLRQCVYIMTTVIGYHRRAALVKRKTASGRVWGCSGEFSLASGGAKPPRPQTVRLQTNVQPHRL